MTARTLRVVFAVASICLPLTAAAQATWQPSAPPLVTAEHETWYLAGDAIIWNGDYYFPAGAQEHFNQYQMVRSGSYRGIPLYTDATRDPYGIVYVPLSGGVMRPYERRRSGELAGTAGNTSPSFPIAMSSEGAVGTSGVVLPQLETRNNPGAFITERPYDVAPGATAVPAPAPNLPVATTGTATTTGAVGTSGTIGGTRYVMPGPIETLTPPTGVNGVWINYEGRRWFALGRAVPFIEGDFTRVGDYHGFDVYQLKSDTSRVFIPSAQGLLAPYGLDKPKIK